MAIVPLAERRDNLEGTQTSTQQAERASRVDSRIDDPDFLLCLALCYLGLPPGIWRTAVNMVLEAVSAEYRETRGDIRGPKNSKAGGHNSRLGIISTNSNLSLF